MFGTGGRSWEAGCRRACAEDISDAVGCVRLWRLLNPFLFPPSLLQVWFLGRRGRFNICEMMDRKVGKLGDLRAGKFCVWPGEENMYRYIYADVQFSRVELYSPTWERYLQNLLALLRIVFNLHDCEWEKWVI